VLPQQTENIIHNRIPFLFYLMKVDKGFESFLDLWNNLPQKAKNHKNARNNKLGDLYEPKPNCNNNTKYDPNYYYPPHQNHVHNKCKIYQNQPNCWSFCTKDIGCWVKDITYCRISNRKAYVHSNNSKCVRPLILVGLKDLSYLWSKPMVYFDCCISRKERDIPLYDFIKCLKSFS